MNGYDLLGQSQGGRPQWTQHRVHPSLTPEKRHRAGDLDLPGLGACPEAIHWPPAAHNQSSPGWTCSSLALLCSRQGLKSSLRHSGQAVWKPATPSARRRDCQLACDGLAIWREGDEPLATGVVAEVITENHPRLRQ